MLAMISRSAAWSTSVTKSLRPLAVTVRVSARLRLRMMISPARRAARTAILRSGCTANKLARRPAQKGRAARLASMAPDPTPEIRIVLVEPSHPGNIGAAARAMMNMDLTQLVLVRPREFPHPEATARAAGADSVLAGARVVATLEEAIADCGFVAATTSRNRDQNFRVLDVRQAAARAVAEARHAPVALLFGAERTGLQNEHLDASHVLLRIPASRDYASLNLAMAVQLVSYEIFRARGAPGAAGVRPPDEGA